jgi:hypothetical protein
MTFVYRYDPDLERPAYTWEELAQCAEREVGIRKRVYPNRVDTNRMNILAADREIAMMIRIAEILRKAASGDLLL